MKKSPRRVNASQQKSDMSLTRIWESITNCKNISREVFIYDFSFLVQCLHCTWQLLDMPSFYTSMIFALNRSCDETLFWHFFNNWACFNNLKKMLYLKALFAYASNSWVLLRKFAHFSYYLRDTPLLTWCITHVY